MEIFYGQLKQQLQKRTEYSLNNYRISLGKTKSINHGIIEHIHKDFKALLVDGYCEEHL